MRLSKDELLHASKEQLGAIGITRSHNKGWLSYATRQEWTAAQVEAFRAKAKRSTDTEPELFKIEPTKSHKPMKYRDPAAELYANDLYEKCGRNLS